MCLHTVCRFGISFFQAEDGIRDYKVTGVQTCALPIYALPGDYKHKIAMSINAGMDMVMVPERYEEFIAKLKEASQDGTVPMARIDDAVRRILRVKFAMGLMDKNHSQLADRELWKQFGSAEHRAVARDAVRQSLVLLKNDGKVL